MKKATVIGLIEYKNRNNYGIKIFKLFKKVK